MPLEARLLTGLAIAAAVVYWSTPLAIRLADRFDFHDKPVGYKGHAAPTPYLGGAALMAGFLAAMLLLESNLERTVPVAAGVVVLWIVGTIDDRRNVAWWARVVVEVSLAVVLWAAGLGWELGLGAGPDIALTIVWLVAVVNAFNLFDNMDGQSATMGLVTASGLAALGIATGDAWLALAGTALAGACFGFLPHNLLTQPARIFLGDGGSMPLGFAVAALAMIGAGGAAPEWQGVAVGLLLVGVPALDTTLVVISRKRRRISLLTGGRDHLTHRARQRLRTALAVAVALGSAQIVLSLLALAASRGSTTILAGVAVLYLVLLAIAVAVIDTRIPAVPPATAAPASVVADTPPATRFAWLPREAPILVVLGAGAGISPLFGGYYSAGVWVPIGLGLIVCLLAVSIARRPQLDLPAWLGLAGLVGLGLWALASTLWADSIEQVVVDANRTLTLAAGLGLLLSLLRDRRGALWAFGAFAAGAVVVEVAQVIALLGAEGPGRFLGGRLNAPLGYINAQGTFSILALWPLLALAEQRRSAVTAGAGLFGATVCVGLVLLSQSRGAALAVVASLVVVMALAPGRQRRGFALVLSGAAILTVSDALFDIAASDPILADSLSSAVSALLAVSLAAGCIWGLFVAAERQLGENPRHTARAALTGVFVAAGLAVLAVGVVKASSITDRVRTQYDVFVNVSATAGGEATSSRLLSGAGTRYDYWRVASTTWRDNPMLGIGAGNYDQSYFLRRATVEDVRQPHSLVMQALVELGLPGLALVLLFLGAIAWGALRWRRAAVASRTERGLYVAAVGMFTAWAVHTQVDWIHLLPGLTGAGLIAAAVLLRPRQEMRRPSPRLLGALPRAAVAAVLVLPLAVTGVSLSRQALGQHYRGQAQDALAADQPDAAIRAADRALRLDREVLPAYYTRAAAFARLGNAEAAEATLRQAIAVEPGDFLTYALLGDLSIRRRDFEAAGSYYQAALARNPLEPTLVSLAQDPQAAALP